ncbi:MAG: hypothetical protein K2K97_09645 [Muribaculaceae bacterium]|nr:hypothetical protein [Muribaculaceae bacterium]
MGLRDIRAVICRAVKEAPHPNNWGENDFMRSEIEGLITDAKWYYVYDAIELFSQKLPADKYMDFESELNCYFIEKGISWQLKNKVIELRGEEAFEVILECAKEVLDAAEVPTSANEIKEAIKDLSRRPDPEITGAIQHSVAALECLSHKVTGE